MFIIFKKYKKMIFGVGGLGGALWIDMFFTRSVNILELGTPPRRGILSFRSGAGGDFLSFRAAIRGQRLNKTIYGITNKQINVK